jgi:hypothetical protein
MAKALATHAATLSAHSPVTGRLADVVAYLDVAAKVLREMGLPDPECDVMAACHMAAVEGGEQADRPAAAFLALFDVAASQPGRLWHPGRTEGEEPHQGWLGVKSPDAWDYIALRPVWVYEQIKIRGYDKEVVEQWKAKGWIQVDSAGKSSIATSTWMGKQRMIRMQRAALEAVLRIGDRVLIGDFRLREALNGHTEPRLVHHHEHGVEALVLRADEPAGGAVIVHDAGRIAVNAHLVLDRAAGNGIARA